MANLITTEMIEAGWLVVHSAGDIRMWMNRELLVEIYLAMEAARSPTSPTDGEDASIFALNLKSIAKRERNIGNTELSVVIDEAALMIARLSTIPTSPRETVPYSDDHLGIDKPITSPREGEN